MTEARELGSDAAHARADAEGERAGTDIARNWGTRNGKFYGEKLGLFRGYIDGLISGAENGKVEGLQDGRADDASFDKGYEDGYAQGEANAKTQAREVIYPNAYRAYRASLMEKIFQGAHLDKNRNTPHSANGVISKGIDDLISEKESLYADQNLPQNKYSEARFAFSVPEVSIPRGQSW